MTNLMEYWMFDNITDYFLGVIFLLYTLVQDDSCIAYNYKFIFFSGQLFMSDPIKVSIPPPLLFSVKIMIFIYKASLSHVIINFKVKSPMIEFYYIFSALY